MFTILDGAPLSFVLSFVITIHIVGKFNENSWPNFVFNVAVVRSRLKRRTCKKKSVF